MSKTDINNAIPETNIDVFTAYNNLMFSGDLRVMSKMLKRTEFFLQTKNLPGDILEFGVFKGASMALWLTLKQVYTPNSQSKVIGFDFFGKQQTLNVLDGEDKECMKAVLSRASTEEISLPAVTSKLESMSCNVKEKKDFILVQGNASETSLQMRTRNPGLKIKLLYMDLDLQKPTYDVLMNLWDNVMVGGIIVFDEYAFHCWSESAGVDQFLKEKKVKEQLQTTGVLAPTAYIVKSGY